MTPSEYLALLERAELRVVDAVPLLKISRATAYRYAAGQTPIAHWVERLLRDAIDAVSVRSFRRRGGRVWQGYRHGQAWGPLADSRAMAFRYALELEPFLRMPKQKAAS